MTQRSAHQPIEGLADSLGRRADLEGLAKGVRMATRRQLLRWALIWGGALVAATLIGAAVDWLAWLPLVTLILALVALGAILAARARATRSVRDARGRLDGRGGTLSDLARDPPKDHPR